ncbi:hypothetical protein RV18_GL002518 [Enterococcus termitis]|nr:hypothetical protein RV18_GL002518 [Enterococcus termitis]
MLLILFFDFSFDYHGKIEFSLIVGLSENYSLKEFLSWFLIYSYMYTCLILSCFRIINQTITSYSLIRYTYRRQVMNFYLKKVLMDLFLNVGIIVLVISIRKFLMPDLTITSEYLSQLVIILTIGIFSSLVIFISRNLYFTIVLVNAYILGSMVFSDILSNLPILGEVLKFPLFLSKEWRESFPVVYFSLLLISLFTALHYITSKKINYL